MKNLKIEKNGVLGILLMFEWNGNKCWANENRGAKAKQIRKMHM